MAPMGQRNLHKFYRTLTLLPNSPDAGSFYYLWTWRGLTYGRECRDVCVAVLVVCCGFGFLINALESVGTGDRSAAEWNA